MSFFCFPEGGAEAQVLIFSYLPLGLSVGQCGFGYEKAHIPEEVDDALMKWLPWSPGTTLWWDVIGLYKSLGLVSTAFSLQPEVVGGADLS